MTLPSQLPIEVSCHDVRARQHASDGNWLLLDCRDPEEHKLAHIDGAMLLPMSELAARFSELERYRDRPIIVHCHHGGRSLRVAQWLRENGFAGAQSMSGGIDQWAVEIDPSVPRY